jgi:hypothetical protein
MKRARSWACAGLFILGAAGLSPQAHAVSTFTLLGGLTLSSPRTALESTLAPYVGMTFGLGFDINVKDHFYVEPEVLYVNRRYSANYTIPTAMIPLLCRFENSFLMIGMGPYIGMLLGASSDTGAAATPGVLALPTVDYGIVVDGGLKLPLTQTIHVFGDMRVSRALNSAYDGTDAFYWGQIQGLVGIQIYIGKKRGYYK